MSNSDVRAGTIDEFIEFVSATGTDRQVYRGQNVDYEKLLPAVYRPGATPPSAASFSHLHQVYVRAYSVFEAAGEAQRKARESYDQRAEEAWALAEEIAWYHGGVEEAWTWLMAVQDPLGGVDEAPYYTELCRAASAQYDDRFALPLLQHYGIATEGLDITFDPLIGLWFAIHRFVQGTDCAASYEPFCGEGVVYVLDTSNATLIDLRDDRGPVGGIRGMHQSGGLLLDSERTHRDLSVRIIRRIRVNHGLCVRARERRPLLRQEHLFPARETDIFYDALLNEKAAADPEIRTYLAGIIEYNSCPIPRRLDLILSGTDVVNGKRDTGTAPWRRMVSFAKRLRGKQRGLVELFRRLF